MPHSLRTDRLLLRPLRLRDAGDLSAAVNDWGVVKETATWGYPQAAERVRDRIRLILSGDPYEDCVFAIVAGGAVIGIVGLHRRRDRTFGLGYMIGRAWWGSGYVTEAVRAVCRFGFAGLRAERIEADVFQDNPASSRVLLKTGFRFAGDPGPGWSAVRLANFPRWAYGLRKEHLR